MFCDRDHVLQTFKGKTVALVGSGPGVLANRRWHIDEHDVVVRVNNYKLFPPTGYRTDVHYSFYGQSIRKTKYELMGDGVKLCMCKCPDAQFIESDWHRQRGKMNGVDFRGIYEDRRDWWFCPTYVPTLEEFMAHFNLLGGHVPTTGFSALLEVLSCEPAHLYVTGFDFFASRVHNVNERWRRLNTDDPIGHVPEVERAWFVANHDKHPISMDPSLTASVAKARDRA